MRATIEKFLPASMEEVKTIKGKLKECRDEWLETKPKGNQKYVGVNTVVQILDFAVDGITYWDFTLHEQWKEQVYKFVKETGAWVFDGYVYHVRGSLFIPGIGDRAQYGCKVAIGGKDNQDSAYKSATSNCINKCASLFGVGSSVYNKITIDTGEADDQAYNNLMQDPNYHVAQQGYNNVYPMQPQYNQQQYDQQQYQQYQQPQGQQWNQQYQEQAGQYPSLGQVQQYQQQEQQQPVQTQQDWYQQTMQQYDPQAYAQMQQQQESQSIQQAFQQADQAVANGQIETPFDNVQPQATVQAQPFEAQPQATVQPQGYEVQTQSFGAPVIETKQEQAPAPEKKEESTPEIWEDPMTDKSDPLAHVIPDNPWNSAEIQEALTALRQHKERLNISTDNQLLPHVREFFKDENATIGSITPDTLVGFNAYLQNIAV